MILIDTSAWIEFLRREGALPVKQRVESAIVEGEAGYTCPIYFELMVGVRKPELELLQQGLSQCRRFVYEPSYWDTAALLYRRLRTQGLTIPKEDVYIAAAAMELRLPLLCRDKHFDVIREKSGMTFIVEQMP